MQQCLRGQRVVVTGAAGSIGSELCRQIAAGRPGVLLLIDRDESGLYRLHESLRASGFEDYVIAPTNILQTRKLDSLFADYSPTIVFHAAAFKHVPLMEEWPDEAVINNVKGTMIVARTAGRHSVQHFVNISTDKAVDPTSVMGATKAPGGAGGSRIVTRVPGHQVLLCPLRQRSRQQRQHAAGLSPADPVGRTGDDHAPGHDALRHDDRGSGPSPRAGPRRWTTAPRSRSRTVARRCGRRASSFSIWASRCASSTWPSGW